MTIKYKLLKKDKDGVVPAIQVTKEDGTIWSVPFDEANTDYQEYLEWAKTNTAEEAD
tara:strand:- start:115 stop:285 length:171 start_codon:yes stop_codon:yes gene_type:complete